MFYSTKLTGQAGNDNICYQLKLRLAHGQFILNATQVNTTGAQAGSNIMLGYPPDDMWQVLQ